MTCAEMGGPETCTAVISGNTPEEAAMNGMQHMEQAHPELAAKMKANSKEENDQWMSELATKWNALPEA